MRSMTNTRKLLDRAAVEVFAAQPQDELVRPGATRAVASTEPASYSRWPGLSRLVQIKRTSYHREDGGRYAAVLVLHMTLEQAVAYAMDQNEQAALSGAQSIAQPGETPQTKGTVSTSPKRAGKQQDDLTGREAEVLRLLAASLSDGQIADRLVLSKRTVQAHVRAIYSKLDVANRSAATRYAIEQGLL